MKAGYFPSHWALKLIQQGFKLGFEFGWLVIVKSTTYVIVGTFACYLLTKKGSELLKSEKI